MKFEKYQHIERLGTSGVEGILNGEVYIFPKIDGTNTGVYLNDTGEVEVNSRNRILSIHSDNVGACNYVQSQEKFKKYLEKHPNHRLFGEWLVPHTIKGYKDDAWRKLYIFDVMEQGDNGEENYLRYEDYLPLLREFKIEMIPCIVMLGFPTVEQVESWLDKCNFLMKDGKSGEGIVIKNYDFKNQWGQTIWAKLVRPKVKAEQMMQKPIDNRAECVENQIVEKFLTAEFIEKEYSKIVVESGGWQSNLIGKLLGVVWYTFITEEIFNALRKFKNPKIDFALLNRLVTKKIKIVKSDIF